MSSWQRICNEVQRGHALSHNRMMTLTAAAAEAGEAVVQQAVEEARGAGLGIRHVLLWQVMNVSHTQHCLTHRWHTAMDNTIIDSAMHANERSDHICQRPLDH